MPVATRHGADAHGLIVGYLNRRADGTRAQREIKKKLRSEAHVTRSTVSHFEADNKPKVPGDVIAAMLITDIPPHTARAHKFVDKLERWVKAQKDANGRRIFKKVDHW